MQSIYEVRARGSKEEVSQWPASSEMEESKLAISMLYSMKI